MGYDTVAALSESALMTAVNAQPVSIEADRSVFQLYAGGVLDSPLCGTQIDHAVLVTGYGTESSGGDYWIVKNSWGESWGMNGYILMARQTASDKGECGMYQYPYVPHA